MEGHPIEFVAKGRDITFYILEDDGKSFTPTKGFSGRAVIQDGGKTTAVALSPAEPNMFVGKLAVPLGSKARVVFSAKVPGHTLQAGSRQTSRRGITWNRERRPVARPQARRSCWC